MAKTAGFLGFVKRNGTAGSPTGTYTTITQINTVTAVGASRNEIDVSAHGDTWVDIIPGRFDGTTVSLTIMHDPADSTHQGLKTDFDLSTQVVRYYELQHPAWTTAYRFPAYVLNWNVEATDDGAMEAHIDLRIVNPGVSSVTPS